METHTKKNKIFEKSECNGQSIGMHLKAYTHTHTHTHTQTISSTNVNTPTVAESFSILSRLCATKKKEIKMNKENFLNG